MNVLVNKLLLKTNIALSMLLLLLTMVFYTHDATAQFHEKDKQFKGVYGAKPKLFGQKKHKYKNVKNKKKRKQLKKRANTRNKAKKQISKRHKRNTLSNRNKSLYSSNANNKKKKGKYPRSKQDFSEKASIIAFTGVAITGNDEMLSDAGMPQNVFANYQPAPTIGLGMFKHYGTNLSYGIKVKAIPFSKENFSVRAVTMGLDVKYNIVSTKQKFSPYVFAGINHSFASVNQSGYKLDRRLGVDFDENYSVQTPENTLVTQIERVEPEKSTGIVPMIGYELGVGFDLKLKKKFSVFAQIEYNNSFARNKTVIQEYFPYNQGDFRFYSISAGIRIGLFKSKSLY